jgi:ABC-2 type transport system ATP-binding protein
MSGAAIATHELLKSYRGKAALNGLTLDVPKGALCGFLGRNGAGKTTTMKLLMGMIRSDGGSLEVLGKPIRTDADAVAVRRRVAFVSEEKELYPFMTVKQTIRFTRPFFPTWRKDLEEKYLKRFRLPLDKAIPKLSKGMRTQLMLLLAMARGAELLLMDEPTSGLDPAMTEEVLQELAALSSDESVTVFFSSHQLAEVEQICDRVALIDQGRLVIEGNLDDLKAQYRRLLLVFDGDAPRELETLTGVDSLRLRGRTASLLAHEDVDGLVKRVQRMGSLSVEVRPVALKELFLDHVRED